MLQIVISWIVHLHVFLLFYGFPSCYEYSFSTTKAKKIDVMDSLRWWKLKCNVRFSLTIVFYKP